MKQIIKLFILCSEYVKNDLNIIDLFPIAPSGKRKKRKEKAERKSMSCCLILIVHKYFKELKKL